jgi:hypothetical protein
MFAVGCLYPAKFSSSPSISVSNDCNREVRPVAVIDGNVGFIQKWFRGHLTSQT